MIKERINNIIDNFKFLFHRKAWGYHLILDCRSCNLDSIKSKYAIQNFVFDLVKDIDMVAYGDPVIEHFANHDPDKGGFTLVQLIETSNITAHFVDKNGDAYIEIFSCKPYNKQKAMAVVRKHFTPQRIRARFIHRQA